MPLCTASSCQATMDSSYSTEITETEPRSDSSPRCFLTRNVYIDIGRDLCPVPHLSHYTGSRNSLEGLLKVGDDVLDVLDPNRHLEKVYQGGPDLSVMARTYPNQIRGHPRQQLLSNRQLLMSGRCGVDHQRLCITDVCQIGCERQTVNQSPSVFRAAFDTKAQHSTKVFCSEALLRVFMVRMGWQTEVGYPCNLWMLL